MDSMTIVAVLHAARRRAARARRRRYFDASTIGRLGAGTPASGSIVTANTFTVLAALHRRDACVAPP